LYCILKKHVICTAYSKKRHLYCILKKRHLYCILKKTSFVLRTQKSTETDFCTAYSKKHVICTADSKKHSKCRQKKGEKRWQKRLQKSWQKNTPKKHIATYTTHMLIIRKKTSLSIFLNLSCCCLETGLKPVLFV